MTTSPSRVDVAAGDIVPRIWDCLQRQAAWFEALARRLGELDEANEASLDEWVREQSPQQQQTGLLEKEFNALLTEWRTARIPEEERERVRSFGRHVAELAAKLEAAYADVDERARAAGTKLGRELGELRRGQRLLSRLNSAGGDTEGYYVDRKT